MKPKKSVYLYQDQEFLGFFQSITEASKYTKESPNVILDVLEGKRQITRKGFHYSTKELTEEERNKLPIKKILKKDKEYKPRYNAECKEISNGFEYEVSCADHNVTYQARNKEERIKQFKYFLYSKLHSHWLTVPKQISNLEKIYINEFLESLS